MAPEPTTSSDCGIRCGIIASLYVHTSSPSGSSPGSARARAPVARITCGARSRSADSPLLVTSTQPFPEQTAVPVVDVDAVLLHQVAHAVAQPFRNGARARHHLLQVEADVGGAEAELVQVAEQMSNLRDAQQRLGRDAAPVEADAPEVLALDERRLHAELASPDRRHVAARTAADDEQVVCRLRHRRSLCLSVSVPRAAHAGGVGVAGGAARHPPRHRYSGRLSGGVALFTSPVRDSRKATRSRFSSVVRWSGLISGARFGFPMPPRS